MVASQTVAVEPKVQVPEPIFKVLAVDPDTENNPAVALYDTASNVPDVKVRSRAELMVRALASCTTPVTESTAIGQPNVTPLLVMVCVPRPANVIVPGTLDEVTPVPNFQSPQTNGVLVEVVNVIAVVRNDASNVPMFQAASIVTVPALPVLSNTAVSCARGKLLTAGAPPEVAAQPVSLQFTAPERFQYTVLAVGNVMPLLPPQLPARVGEEPAAVPAMVMSRKSQSVADSVPTVRVRVVPSVLERTKIRRTAVAPATVSVPLMVWLAANTSCIKPDVAGAVTVKLVNEFAPDIVCDTGEDPVKDTL